MHWPFCNIIFLKIHIIRVQEEDSLLKNNVQILVFLLVMLKISNLHFLISHQKSAFHLLTLKSPFPRLLQLHTLRINHSTTVYYIHICENQVWRESVFSSFVISTNSTTRCTGMYWIEPRENLILANQPIQPLFTTYVYVKIRFREKMLLRGLAYQPIQPLDVQVYVGWSLARK